MASHQLGLLRVPGITPNFYSLFLLFPFLFSYAKINSDFIFDFDIYKFQSN